MEYRDSAGETQRGGGERDDSAGALTEKKVQKAISCLKENACDSRALEAGLAREGGHCK